jgi:hypothetical protein
MCCQLSLQYRRDHSTSLTRATRQTGDLVGGGPDDSVLERHLATQLESLIQMLQPTGRNSN